jgi:hypothetical protein
MSFAIDPALFAHALSRPLTEPGVFARGSCSSLLARALYQGQARIGVEAIGRNGG